MSLLRNRTFILKVPFGIQRPTVVAFNRHICALQVHGQPNSILKALSVRLSINQIGVNTMNARFCSTKAATEQPSTGGAPPPTTITFRQGAKAATQGTLWLGIGGLVILCAGLIIRELMPTRLSPNSIFNSAFEKVKNHPEVVARIGENIKGYGREYSRSKEGRRNFVDHDSFKDLDGNKHMRIKFTLEGTRGKLNCYAEVSEDLAPGEFTYIIIEQYLRGQSDAIALVDNRKQYSREELQEKVSKRLAGLGSVLYGHSNCQWTQRQKIEFGEYVNNLRVVLCDKPENQSECEKAQLKGYPVWMIKGEQLPGFQPLEQLQEIVQHM